MNGGENSNVPNAEYVYLRDFIKRLAHKPAVRDPNYPPHWAFDAAKLHHLADNLPGLTDAEVTEALMTAPENPNLIDVLRTLHEDVVALGAAVVRLHDSLLERYGQMTGKPLPPPPPAAPPAPPTSPPGVN